MYILFIFSILTFWHLLSDGVGRTGTFIRIHSQLEQLKTEGVVDIFQSIKSARIHRAGLVQSVVWVYWCSQYQLLVDEIKWTVYFFVQEQYVLCHNVLADFVDSFETYANFKDIIWCMCFLYEFNPKLHIEL